MFSEKSAIFTSESTKKKALLLDNLQAVKNSGAELASSSAWTSIQKDLRVFLKVTAEAHNLCVVAFADESETPADIAKLFPKKIELKSPDTKQRVLLLRAVFSKYKEAAEALESHYEDLALRTNNFTVGDFWNLAMEFRLRLADTAGDSQKCLHAVKESISETKPITLNFQDAVTTPKVRWNEIGGYGHVKQLLQHSVILPLKHPEVFKTFGLKPSRGVLLYGPPGCSKTMFAKALATESNYSFISIKGPEVFSKYVGDSEKAIRDVFAKARLNAPCLVFFDEIDAIAEKRGESMDVNGKVLTQLLTEMDGFQAVSDVFVLAATNRPHSLDSALIRPGRIGEHIFINLPDDEARKEIILLTTKGMRVRRQGEEIEHLEDLIKLTQGYSGAEIVEICNLAAKNAIPRFFLDNSTHVEKSDFEHALANVKRGTDQASLEVYKKFRNTSTSTGK